MTKATRVTDILNSWWHGTRTMSEAERALERLQIRGGFRRGAFTGYDYEAQRWIEFPSPRA